MKIRGSKIALKQERDRLVLLIRTAQEDYLNKGKLDTRIYENMLKTYGSRLSKIEEEMVFAEAQEAIKKVTGWKFSNLFGGGKK
jgi:flagellar capping protein FliD